jgi:hypothetical protein
VDKGGGSWLRAALKCGAPRTKVGRIGVRRPKGHAQRSLLVPPIAGGKDHGTVLKERGQKCHGSLLHNTSGWKNLRTGDCDLACISNDRGAKMAAMGRCCLAVVALTMAWAQIGRAQEGIAWTMKANAAVDTGRVPGVSGQRGPDPDCKGWFLARPVNGMVAVESVSNVNTASVSAVRDFPAGVLIGTLNGLFLARMGNGVVSVGRAGNADTGTVWAVRDLPGGGMLIGATSGLFLARVENGALIIERAGNAAGGFAGTPADFAGGVLIGSTNGWFLARTQNGAVIVDRAGGEDPAPVFTMHDFPAGGV